MGLAKGSARLGQALVMKTYGAGTTWSWPRVECVGPYVRPELVLQGDAADLELPVGA